MSPATVVPLTHTFFTTTELYIREAEVVRDGFGEVFPPLPAVLVSGAESSRESSAAGVLVRNQRFLRCAGRIWTEFLCALISHRVRFVLIGGHAVAGHGEPRLTEDLDVFVEPTLANARRLREALAAFGLDAVAPPAADLANLGRSSCWGDLLDVALLERHPGSGPRRARRPSRGK